ncbi:MAG: preprotein translocase subunit SecD [Methanotrichaceae archaeon]|jgi:preprotein translocase subunit SecD
MKLSQNPRILLYLAAISLSIIFIAVHGVNYGIDIQGGSSLQLQLEGAIVELNVDSSKILEQQFNTSSVQTLSDGYVVTVNGAVSTDLLNKLGYSGSKVAERNNTTRITISTSPESVVANYLKNALDADVKVVGVEPVQYEIRTNTTRESLNAILAPVGGSVDTSPQGFVEGLTPQTVQDTKSVLDQKLNRLGLKDIKVRVVGSQYILIDMAGLNVAQAQDLVGTPGKFEIRIQTQNNETEHVLYGDAVESVDIPSNNQGMWGVPFTLSDDGAKILQKAAIDSGATKNPTAHELSMYLDKDQIFSAPLAPELAASLQKTPSRSMVAEVGTGDAGSQKAKVLYIDLKEGALPVNVKVIGSGQVTAALGNQFKIQIVVAGLLALLAVGGMIYWRYRVRRIVLPLTATSTSEVIMILAVLSALGQQLDLAAIAGLITVIGTGVDQLVIITDRLMRGATALPSKGEGKYAVSGGRLHEKRIMEILGIIIGSAATTVAAMLPLPFMGFGALTGFAVTVIIGVVVGVGIARPAYASIADYILGEDEKPEAKAIGEDSSPGVISRKVAAKEGIGKETAGEETNGRKAAKTRRKKGSRKNEEENSKEE